MRVIPSVVVKGKFVDFEDLTRAQQDQALRLRPKWKPLEFADFAFWVKPNGELSTRKGHHQPTAASCVALEAELQSTGEQHALEHDDRGDMRRHRTTRFSVNKEPVS